MISANWRLRFLSLLRDLFLALLLVIPFTQNSLAVDRRSATLEWQPVEDASEYNLHISVNSNMVPTLKRVTTRQPKAVVNLIPGAYYFRVRGVDDLGSPGPWSDVDGFRVNLPAPKQITPRTKKTFKEILPKRGITFTWEPGVSGSEYIIEIRDRSGIHVSRRLDDPVFLWSPSFPGIYYWRIGFQTRSGKEWGKKRIFKVTKTAFPKSERDKFTKMKAPVIGYDAKLDKGDEWGFSIFARYAQSLVVLSIVDQGSTESPFNSSGFIGAGSFEIRWRAPRPPLQKWRITGSINLEILRQVFNKTNLWMPRGYFRTYFLIRQGRMYYGPFLHFNSGLGGIARIPTEGTFLTFKPIRHGAGGGAVFVYQGGDQMYMSMIVMGRYDFGGEITNPQSSLDGTLGMEVGFGMSFTPTKNISIEGRVLLLTEKYAWSPGDNQNGEFSTQFVIFDLGVGYAL